MKPPDILGLFIRLVAFAIIIWSTWNVLGGISVLVSSQQSYQGSVESQYSFSSYFIIGLPALAVGLFCFLCAERIVRWTYPE